MSNKLIITESQYSKLLLYIDEAKKYDTTINEPNLARIKNTILSVKKDNSLVFDLVDGTKISMCFIGEDPTTYTFKINYIKGSDKFSYLEDNFIVLTKNITTDNLRIVKDGIYEIIIKFYRKNKKLFKTEKLKFNSVNIGPNCINKKEQSNIPNEKNGKGSKLSGDTEDNIDYEKVRNEAKKAYEMIVNDKKLQQAFYKAPSLLDLFKAELKGKKAPGKGILVTLDLVGRYNHKNIIERLGADFIPGYNILFKIYKTSPISSLSNNKTYSGLILEDKKELGSRVFLEVEGDDNIKQIIYIKAPINDIPNGFNGYIKPKNKKEKEIPISIIVDEKSEGYKKINK